MLLRMEGSMCAGKSFHHTLSFALTRHNRQGSTDWLEGRAEDWCWKQEAGTVSISKR